MRVGYALLYACEIDRNEYHFNIKNAEIHKLSVGSKFEEVLALKYSTKNNSAEMTDSAKNTQLLIPISPVMIRLGSILG
jgi:NOL1/NOP2/fmu family ribosome biogenesis protein